MYNHFKIRLGERHEALTFPQSFLNLGALLTDGTIVMEYILSWTLGGTPGEEKVVALVPFVVAVLLRWKKNLISFIKCG